MSKQLIFRVALVDWAPNTEPNTEHDPVIHVYMDATFGDTPFRRVAPLFPGTTAPSITTLTTHLFRFGSQAAELASPSYACLCFALSVVKINESGVPCMCDAGVAYISWNEIVAAAVEGFVVGVACLLAYSLTPAPPRSLTRKLTFQMAEEDNLIKGWATVMVSFDGSGLQGFASTTAPPGLASVYVGDQLARLIDTHIAGCQAIEVGRADTITGTGNVRCPYYLGSTRSPLLRTDILPPAIAYLLCETPFSNRAFWENALTLVQGRYGIPEFPQSQVWLALL